MKFRTEVNIDKPTFSIRPLERMLFVGSCFADNIGRRFLEDKFRAVVNPYGVMYNPVSVLHTVKRFVEDSRQSSDVGASPFDESERCPQRLFQEEELTIDQCCEALSEAVGILEKINPEVKVIVTVSPIRYAKYGFHGSQLSKATLLLAADKLCREHDNCTYFPAYEIVNDELRDYRFYKEDMLHPSEQAVSYIWERFSELYFSKEASSFLEKWRPIKEALGHKPFNPDAEEYKLFMLRTMEKIKELQRLYPELDV